MEELTIGDKIYISSKRAAEITGYAKDYVGQLCREGRVEATLVGRSWYVLESSIKEHRFGSEGNISSEKETDTKSSTAFDTWEKPSYSAEGLPELPAFQGSSINVLNKTLEPVNPPEAPAQSIEDMQSAWKEWFATRKEPLLETEEVIEERESKLEEEKEEEDRVYEPVQQEEVYDPIPSTPEVEEIVEIHRSYEPINAPVAAVEAVSEEVIERRAEQRPKRRRKGKGGTHLATRALLISLALAVSAIGAIGAGLFDSVITKEGVQYEIIRVLGGTSIKDN